MKILLSIFKKINVSELRVCLVVVNVPGSPVVLVIGGHVLTCL